MVGGRAIGSAIDTALPIHMAIGEPIGFTVGHGTHLAGDWLRVLSLLVAEAASVQTVVYCKRVAFSRRSGAFKKIEAVTQEKSQRQAWNSGPGNQAKKLLHHLGPLHSRGRHRKELAEPGQIGKARPDWEFHGTCAVAGEA